MQDGPPLRRCQFRFARSSYLVLYMIDLILFYVIPLVVATVLYLLIGRILYMSRNIRRNDAQLVVRSSLQEAPHRRGDSRIQVGQEGVAVNTDLCISLSYYICQVEEAASISKEVRLSWKSSFKINIFMCVWILRNDTDEWNKTKIFQRAILLQHSGNALRNMRLKVKNWDSYFRVSVLFFLYYCSKETL